MGTELWKIVGIIAEAKSTEMKIQWVATKYCM